MLSWSVVRYGWLLTMVMRLARIAHAPSCMCACKSVYVCICVLVACTYSVRTLASQSIRRRERAPWSRDGFAHMRTGPENSFPDTRLDFRNPIHANAQTCYARVCVYVCVYIQSNTAAVVRTASIRSAHDHTRSHSI